MARINMYLADQVHKGHPIAISEQNICDAIENGFKF